MQEHLDVGAVIGESVLVVADILDHAARDLGDQLAIGNRVIGVFLEQRCLPAALAGDDDLIRGAERLAAKPGIDLAFVGNSELDIVFDERVEDGVGNLIANLVGVTLGHGLAGEKIIHMGHRNALLIWRGTSRARSLMGNVCYSVPERGQDVGSGGADLGKRSRRNARSLMVLTESELGSSFLFGHDLFRKPVPTPGSSLGAGIFGIMRFVRG